MNRPAWLLKSELTFLVLLCSALLLLAPGNVCNRSIRRTKQAVLTHDLQVMRMAIDAYTFDEEDTPKSLQDLVAKRYLSEIPANPFTGKKDWVPTFKNVVVGPGKTSFGVDYVYSGTAMTDCEGWPRHSKPLPKLRTWP
jgi:competence protein ComGC